MEIYVCKLSVELLDDWLTFFDNDAFSDDDEWCGCYCMCYHWDSKLEKKRSWDCDESCADFNRKQAIKFIKSGRMKGYLAYADGKVVGWCNANNKKAYVNVNFNFSEEVPDNGEKIKSIVCFSISPKYRGRGVASALLDYVCKDAESEGFDLIEAYPFVHDRNNAYHGPLSMYEKSGFEIGEKIEGCIVCRKTLKNRD